MQKSIKEDVFAINNTKCEQFSSSLKCCLGCTAIGDICLIYKRCCKKSQFIEMEVINAIKIDNK